MKDIEGNIVSTLEKRNPGCFRACYTNSDDFSLVFPAGISTEDKALLLAAALFVDYRYFENPQKENAIMWSGQLLTIIFYICEFIYLSINLLHIHTLNIWWYYL